MSIIFTCFNIHLKSYSNKHLNKKNPTFITPKTAFKIAVTNLENYLLNFKVLNVFGSPLVPPALLLAMI